MLPYVMPSLAWRFPHLRRLFVYHATACFSRCGTIRLADLRASGFVPSLNGVGRLEIGLEVRQLIPARLAAIIHFSLHSPTDVPISMLVRNLEQSAQRRPKPLVLYCGSAGFHIILVD